MKIAIFGLLAMICVSCSNTSLDVKAPDPKPIKALLVVGGCCHEYGKQKDLITQGISKRATVEWTIAHEPSERTDKLNPIYEKEDWYKGFDVIVHDECTSDITDPKIIDRILKPHREGLPAVVLHCGIHSFRSKGFPKSTPWFDFTGLPSTGHGPQVPIEITFTDPQNEITKGLENWTTGNEELYNNSQGKLLPTAHALAKGKQTYRGDDGKEVVDESIVVWTNTYNGKTRVFGTTLGHNTKTVGDDRYLDLITRGMLWSVSRLNDENLQTVSPEK